MVIQGISFRNIITKIDRGQRPAGLKRHKTNAFVNCFGEGMIERRGGLLLSRRPVAADRVGSRPTSENRIRQQNRGIVDWNHLDTTGYADSTGYAVIRSRAIAKLQK